MTESPFQVLRAAGFDLDVRNHAEAILTVDFPQIAAELAERLLRLQISAAELIGSGGGEAPSTQRLRHDLYDAGWPKHNFQFGLTVDGVERISQSHEIDHVKRCKAGTLALEIEWNNKDPFFDRDLENFQRLHAQSAISVGLLITRGASLQAALPRIIEREISQRGIVSEAEMVDAFQMNERTKRQRDAVQKHLDAQMPFAAAFARQFVSDKFGAATTHWQKLEDRIARGVGNPCPLVLIGLPARVVA